MSRETEDAAGRLAENELSATLLRALRLTGLDLPTAALPCETLLALAISWDANQEALQRHLDSIGAELSRISGTMDGPAFIDRALGPATRAAAGSSTPLDEEYELSFSKFLTPDRIAAVVRVEDVLQERFGAALDSLRRQLRSAILNRLDHDPQLARSLQSNAPVSTELTISRMRFALMLEEARLKRSAS